MIDIEIMVKVLRFVWILRLLILEISNWKMILNYYFSKIGGLNFLLRCNYDVKYIDSGFFLFYKDIFIFFNELKNFYSYDGM